MSPIASDSSTAQLEPSGEPNLRRDLRLPQVLAIVIGAIVGTGIYIRPASIAQMLGSPGLIIGVWLAGGALALCGALTYAQLAVRFPGTGGEYVFLKATIGRLPAFLYGWMRLAVGPAVIRVMAVAFTVFVGDIVPLGDPWTQIRWTWGTTAGAVELGPRQAIAVSAILGLAWINTKGVGRAGSFQLVVTSGKVLGLLLLLATIAVFGHSSVEQQPLPEAVRGPFVLEFGGALLAVMSAYNGWANAAIVGGEVWDAKRTVRFALLAGIVIVTGLYVMSNLAFLHTLSLQDIGTANSSRYRVSQAVR